jgi:hypothetical protein
MSKTVHVQPGTIVIVDNAKPKKRKAAAAKGKIQVHADGTMTVAAPKKVAAKPKKKAAAAKKTKRQTQTERIAKAVVTALSKK